MRDFSISTFDDGTPSRERCRVVVAGEIDLATTVQIDRSLPLLAGDVIVDCAAVDFIDSAGFHAFERGYTAALARGSTFSISGLSDLATLVARFFELPCLDPTAQRSR